MDYRRNPLTKPSLRVTPVLEVDRVLKEEAQDSEPIRDIPYMLPGFL